jgi:uncharacterized damage-inducible protein DinB
VNEIKHTAVALKMVTEGPGWHGPSVQHILKDITADEARLKPATGGACIWEILLHMRVWQRQALSALSGRTFRWDLPPQEDWPAMADSGAEAWESLKSDVAGAHRELREALKKLAPGQLESAVQGEREHPLYALIHGIIAHEAYHGGQIALIKSSLRRMK